MAGSTANDEKQGGGKGAEMMAVMWGLTGVTTFIVVARLFIRQKVLRVLGLDDWLIAISMVSTCLYLEALRLAGPSTKMDWLSTGPRVDICGNRHSIRSIWLW